MEYFRRCIDQAGKMKVQAAINDVLTENGFIQSSDYYNEFSDYKKYSIDNIDFRLYITWNYVNTMCCILKEGNFNNEGRGNKFVMSSLDDDPSWQGNTTLNFVFIPLKNDGYFINFSGLKKFDEFPNIAIKNKNKEGTDSYLDYFGDSDNRWTFSLTGIPSITDSILDRPCFAFFSTNIKKDGTIYFNNHLDFNGWPNKSGEDPITYLDDTMEHFDYQPNICTLVKYPLEDGYIGNLYLMATSPVNKVTEDGMFFSIGNRNVFNIYGNLVVELPADKEDYQWQLR